MDGEDVTSVAFVLPILTLRRALISFMLDLGIVMGSSMDGLDAANCLFHVWVRTQCQPWALVEVARIGV